MVFKSSGEVEFSFDPSLIGGEHRIKSVNIVSEETIGNTLLYNATITSIGTRRDALTEANGGIKGVTDRRFADTFSNIRIAKGGKFFVYSRSVSGNCFEPHLIQDIAAQFEADHPEWTVAIVVNASFFDNETARTPDKGEPDEIYVEDGRVYKTYFEQGVYDSAKEFKRGRGILGLCGTDSLDSSNRVIYHTFENGTNYYTGSTSLDYTDARFSPYYLEVMGEDGKTVICEYPLSENKMPNDAEQLSFFYEGNTVDLSGKVAYKMKIENFRAPHVTVNGVETGITHRYFEGKIEDVIDGTSDMSVPSGYLYFATCAPLSCVNVGARVRVNKKMTDDLWKDADYVFGYKQQILHEGEVLFDGVLQNTYADGTLYYDGEEAKKFDHSWSEDYVYASYGSNRTAFGFCADGTPVVITMPRKIYRSDDGTRTIGETSGTYSEIASYMKALGCVNAFVLDGGGSMGMYKKNPVTGEYEPECCEPTLDAPNRLVANAVILAYPTDVK